MRKQPNPPPLDANRPPPPPAPPARDHERGYPLRTDATVLLKLGSIAVHVEEYLSAGGHPLDRIALQALLDDPEIKEWLAAMDKLALLPRKRT